MTAPAHHLTGIVRHSSESPLPPGKHPADQIGTDDRYRREDDGDADALAEPDVEPNSGSTAKLAKIEMTKATALLATKGS